MYINERDNTDVNILLKVVGTLRVPSTVNMLLIVVGTLRVPSTSSKTHNGLCLVNARVAFTLNSISINQDAPDAFRCLV